MQRDVCSRPPGFAQIPFITGADFRPGLGPRRVNGGCFRRPGGPAGGLRWEQLLAYESVSGSLQTGGQRIETRRPGRGNSERSSESDPDGHVGGLVLHQLSEVGGHPTTLTSIHQMNLKSSQDIDEVINNDFLKRFRRRPRLETSII